MRKLVGFLNRRTVFYFLLLSLSCCFLAPQTTYGADQTLQDQFQRANEAYFARNFEEAIQLYTDLEKRGVSSGDLFYNLGNVYYRTGQIGLAIHSYLKALRYHPRDRDLVANYQYVLSKRIDQIEKNPSSKIFHTLFFWAERMTLKELLITSILVYWLFFALLTLRIYHKRSLLSVALALVLGLNLILLPTAGAKYYSEKIQRVGVVFAPQAPVFSEPAEGAIQLFELHEGTTVNLVDQEGNYLKIKLSDGKKGWVEQKNMKEIL